MVRFGDAFSILVPRIKGMVCSIIEKSIFLPASDKLRTGI
jgi:hypothetical protein